MSVINKATGAPRFTPAAPAPAAPISEPTKPKRGGGHQRPSKSPLSLDNDLARVRVRDWLSYLGNLSASAFYVRLHHGLVPAPCGHDPRPYWTARVVREFLSK